MGLMYTGGMTGCTYPLGNFTPEVIRGSRIIFAVFLWVIDNCNCKEIRPA